MKKSKVKEALIFILVITIMIIIGSVFVYMGFPKQFENIRLVRKHLFKRGPFLLTGIFFIGIALYLTIYFISNCLIPAKDKVMYLDRIEDGLGIFLDLKGKKYYFRLEPTRSYVPQKFYHVMATSDYIEKVLDYEYSYTEPIREKESYWLNYYGPGVHVNDVFLLPIVYFILFFFFFFFLLGKNKFEKIILILLMLIPLSIILYDFIFKQKKKKLRRKLDIINDSKFANDLATSNVKMKDFSSIQIFVMPVARLTSSILILSIMAYLFRKVNGLQSKLLLSPFILVGILLVLFSLKEIHITYNITHKKNTTKLEKTKNILRKLILVVVLIFWSSIIIMGTINFVQSSGLLSALYLTPFYVLTIFIIKKEFFPNKK